MKRQLLTAVLALVCSLLALPASGLSAGKPMPMMSGSAIPGVGASCVTEGQPVQGEIKPKGTWALATMDLYANNAPVKRMMSLGLGTNRNVGHYPLPYMAHNGCFTPWDLSKMHAEPGQGMPIICLTIRIKGLRAHPGTTACGVIEYDPSTGWYVYHYKVDEV
jgi:hypothetical protein